MIFIDHRLAQEELDAEFFAQYDYVQEANHGMADDPASIAFEMADIAREEWIEHQDAIEARGGPIYTTRITPDFFDDVPF